MLTAYHQLRIIEKTKDTYEPKKIVAGKKYMDRWLIGTTTSWDPKTQQQQQIAPHSYTETFIQGLLNPQKHFYSTCNKTR